MSKRRKHRNRDTSCDECGEDEKTIHTVVIQIDGKATHRWRLCKPCKAVKVVSIADHAPRRK